MIVDDDSEVNYVLNEVMEKPGLIITKYLDHNN